MKPFVSWTGGKSHLVPHIVKHVPMTCRSFISPFLGGGAVELATLECYRTIQHAYLSDANNRLIAAWRGVLRAPALIADELDRLEARADFSRTRRELNAGFGPAHFIWCVQRGFSALYRENSAGDYNTSEDRDKKRPLPSRDKLCAVSNLLASRSVRLTCQSWESALSTHVPGEGDVVFLDPPYRGTFGGYHSSSWSPATSDALFAEIAVMTGRGATVILCETVGVYDDVCRISGEPTEYVTRRKNTTNNGAVPSTMTEAIFVWRKPS